MQGTDLASNMRAPVVVVVARDALLRDGTAHLLAAAGVVVAATADATKSLDGAMAEARVVVLQLTSPADLAGLHDSADHDLRIVALHDSLPSSAVDTGSDTTTILVDTADAPSSMIEAVKGSGSAGPPGRADGSAVPLPISARERSVLRQIADGSTAREIASKLGLSVRTIEKHKQRVFQRFGVRNQAQAVAVATRHGLLDLRSPRRTGAPPSSEVEA